MKRLVIAILLTTSMLYAQIEDPIFEKCIKDNIGMDENDELTQEILGTITELYCDENYEINSLRGVNDLTNLEDLTVVKFRLKKADLEGDKIMVSGLGLGLVTYEKATDQSVVLIQEGITELKQGHSGSGQGNLPSEGDEMPTGGTGGYNSGGPNGGFIGGNQASNGSMLPGGGSSGSSGSGFEQAGFGNGGTQASNGTQIGVGRQENNGGYTMKDGAGNPTQSSSQLPGSEMVSAGNNKNKTNQNTTNNNNNTTQKKETPPAKSNTQTPSKTNDTKKEDQKTKPATTTQNNKNSNTDTKKNGNTNQPAKTNNENSKQPVNTKTEEFGAELEVNVFGLIKYKVYGRTSKTEEIDKSSSGGCSKLVILPPNPWGNEDMPANPWDETGINMPANPWDADNISTPANPWDNSGGANIVIKL